jgi:hypothetical protein
MQTKRVLPSLIVLGIVGLSYLYFSAIRGVFSEANSNPYRLAVEKGFDFKSFYSQLKQFRTATVPEGAHPIFDFTPQSLAALSPLGSVTERTGYHLLTIGSFLVLWIIFGVLANALNAGSPLFYVLLFPVVSLVALPGIGAFGRGNIEVLVTCLVAGAFLAVWHKKIVGYVLLVSLVVVLKPVFLPLTLPLFFARRRQSLWILFGLVQLAAVFAAYVLGGTQGFLKFFAGPEGFINHAVAGDWPCLFVLASFGGLGFFCFDWLEIKATYGNSENLPRLFLFLLFATIFWQCCAVPIGLLSLVMALPVMDRLFAQERSASSRSLLVAAAVFLAVSFAPLPWPWLGSVVARNIYLGLALMSLSGLFYRLRQPRIHACVAKSQLSNKQKIERWLCVLES